MPNGLGYSNIYRKTKTLKSTTPNQIRKLNIDRTLTKLEN